MHSNITEADYYFTCSARARIPAASGADADVPVWRVVHLLFKSVVALNQSKKLQKLKIKIN